MFGIFQNLIITVVANSGFLAAVIALGSFIYTSKRQREIEKNSMYQQLELASVELFRWEASNREELSRIRENYQNATDDDVKLIESYFTQVMNLFELCIHNENKRMLPGKVFGSWLPWIYEFANEPEFDNMWYEIRLNYMPECRLVMESAAKNTKEQFIREICKRYRLKENEWLEEEITGKDATDDKKQYDDSNVDIKKGNTKNIGKYLSIFDECKHDDYISHGEILCGRATLDMKWANNIITQMRSEFVYYIFSRKCDLLEILLEGELTGFAVIELNKKTKAAVLADIMIKRGYQGKGTGKKALRKIEEYLKSRGMEIMLLESGINNEKAHEFFEKNGYKKISAEFSKMLN